MWKKLQKTIAPYILYLIVKFIYATNKKVYHHPKDDKEPFIPAEVGSKAAGLKKDQPRASSTAKAGSGKSNSIAWLAHRRGQLFCPLDPTPDKRLWYYRLIGSDAIITDNPAETIRRLRG